LNPQSADIVPLDRVPRDPLRHKRGRRHHEARNAVS
jgi:hypothetical protein